MNSYAQPIYHGCSARRIDYAKLRSETRLIRSAMYRLAGKGMRQVPENVPSSGVIIISHVSMTSMVYAASSSSAMSL